MTKEFFEGLKKERLVTADVNDSYFNTKMLKFVERNKIQVLDNEIAILSVIKEHNYRGIACGLGGYNEIEFEFTAGRHKLNKVVADIIEKTNWDNDEEGFQAIDEIKKEIHKVLKKLTITPKLWGGYTWDNSQSSHDLSSAYYKICWLQYVAYSPVERQCRDAVADYVFGKTEQPTYYEDDYTTLFRKLDPVRYISLRIMLSEQSMTADPYIYEVLISNVLSDEKKQEKVYNGYLKGVSKRPWMEPKEKNVVINKLRHQSGFWDFDIYRGDLDEINKCLIA